MKKIQNFLIKIIRKSKEVWQATLKHQWLALVVIILVVSFCWFQLRPSIIKGACYDRAKGQAVGKLKKEDLENGKRAQEGFMEKDYDTYYRWCLQSKGL